MKKTYAITIKVEIPYPKELTYRIEATNLWTAVTRALKQAKAELGRKIIKEWKIHVNVLGASSVRMLTNADIADEVRSLGIGQKL